MYGRASCVWHGGRRLAGDHMNVRRKLSLPLMVVTLGLLWSSMTGTPLAHAATTEVLILESTVIGGESSAEASAVKKLGLTPRVVDADTWSGMSKADFGSYRGIVLGDASCG